MSGAVGRRDGHVLYLDSISVSILVAILYEFGQDVSIGRKLREEYIALSPLFLTTAWQPATKRKKFTSFSGGNTFQYPQRVDSSKSCTYRSLFL